MAHIGKNSNPTKYCLEQFIQARFDGIPIHDQTIRR